MSQRTLHAACCSAVTSASGSVGAPPPGQQQLAEQLAAAASAPATGSEPDAPAAGPYRTVLLNDDVLLFETMLQKGQKLPMHSHPRPHLRYTFSEATQKHTWPDGSTSIQEDKQGHNAPLFNKHACARSQRKNGGIGTSSLSTHSRLVSLLVVACRACWCHVASSLHPYTPQESTNGEFSLHQLLQINF